MPRATVKKKGQLASSLKVSLSDIRSMKLIRELLLDEKLNKEKVAEFIRSERKGPFYFPLEFLKGVDLKNPFIPRASTLKKSTGKPSLSF
jgi:hypothetical protein